MEPMNLRIGEKSKRLPSARIRTESCEYNGKSNKISRGPQIICGSGGGHRRISWLSKRYKEYFAQFGVADRVQEFNVSSATVELAAQALNCQPCQIAKTLSSMVGGLPILIVTAGDAKIDNPKYKAQFRTKAKMLTPDEVETLIGHTVGGVCPFGINKGVTVYLDSSLKQLESVFPACGSSNSAIELSIGELESYSGYTAWIDVCKGWDAGL